MIQSGSHRTNVFVVVFDLSRNCPDLLPANYSETKWSTVSSQSTAVSNSLLTRSEYSHPD